MNPKHAVGSRTRHWMAIPRWRSADVRRKSTRRTRGSRSPRCTASSSRTCRLPAGTEMNAAILWVTPTAQSVKVVGTRVAVTGSFPANFTLDLYTPPPADGESIISGASSAQGNTSSPYGFPVDIDSPTGVWVGVLEPSTPMSNQMPILNRSMSWA